MALSAPEVDAMIRDFMNKSVESKRDKLIKILIGFHDDITTGCPYSIDDYINSIEGLYKTYPK